MNYLENHLIFSYCLLVCYIKSIKKLNLLSGHKRWINSRGENKTFHETPERSLPWGWKLIHNPDRDQMLIHFFVHTQHCIQICWTYVDKMCTGENFIITGTNVFTGLLGSCSVCLLSWLQTLVESCEMLHVNQTLWRHSNSLMQPLSLIKYPRGSHGKTRRSQDFYIRLLAHSRSQKSLVHCHGKAAANVRGNGLWGPAAQPRAPSRELRIHQSDRMN